MLTTETLEAITIIIRGFGGLARMIYNLSGARVVGVTAVDYMR